MKYISVSDAAQKWNITVRRAQDLCKMGAIEGATRFGRAWMIPENATKPVDRRTKTGKEIPIDDGLPHLPMPRKNPFLIYTDLYSTPGTADDAVKHLEDSGQIEAAKIMQSQLDYQRGKIDKIYEDAQYFLKAHSGFNAVISAASILAMAAMWRGDIHLWRQARQHMYEAPCKDENERQALLFWLAVTDSMMYDTSEFPEWFKVGIFDCLPADSYSVARVFYVKYHFISAHELAKGHISLKDVEKLGLMRTLPYIIEPMIAQAKIEKTLFPEVYLHLMAATVYHNLGDDGKAIPHVDRAIELVLPDRMFSSLVEYRTNLDSIIDDRLAVYDADAQKAVKELHKQMIEGWVKLHNLLLERNVSNTLTVREREVARLAAFGYKDKEIAARLSISIHTVQSLVKGALNKTNATDRHELGAYV